MHINARAAFSLSRSGTRLRTDTGDRHIEDLQVGDRLLCMDGAFHSIRWTGRRKVNAVGDLAPVHIRAGTFSNRRDLMFTPAHRIRISNLWAEMVFGTASVLVAVQDLLSVPGVSRAPDQVVDCHHVLLDTHQMVLSDGLWSETLNPTQSIDTLDRRALSEVLSTFPVLESGVQGHTQPGLPTLSPLEVTDLLKLITRQ
ncbi:MAG: Hint domain-containing protein [Pseudomonadota bacterium]